MIDQIIDNITYKVGKNAKENTELINLSNTNWYWFHLEKFASCHVVVCTEELTNEMIGIAGNLVKENSKYKFKNIGINYCKIDNLLHGKEPGSVYFKSNKQVKKFNL
jgi:predicted ribosome quality control (RQC) complex YloA/Tae2 family protein